MPHPPPGRVPRASAPCNGASGRGRKPPTRPPGAPRSTRRSIPRLRSGFSKLSTPPPASSVTFEVSVIFREASSRFHHKLLLMDGGELRAVGRVLPGRDGAAESALLSIEHEHDPLLEHRSVHLALHGRRGWRRNHRNGGGRGEILRDKARRGSAARPAPPTRASAG